MRDTTLELEIEVTIGHCLGGPGNDVFPGDRLKAPGQISIASARAKVRDGLAKLVSERLEPEPVVSRDPAPESRDPAADHRDPLMTSAAAPPAAEGQTSAASSEAADSDAPATKSGGKGRKGGK